MTAGSSLQSVIASQRAALLRQDAATLRLVLRSWVPVQRRLTADLERLLVAIGDDTPTPDQLRRMARYRDLIEQTKVVTDAYAAGVLPQITAAQQSAVGLAVRHADALIGVDAVRLPVAATQDLIGALSDGSPLSDILKTYGDDAAARASDVLISGLASGRGLRAVAAEFRKATGASAVRAARLARTETLRAYRSASLQTYQANSDIVQHWRWLSARQRRTCSVCWAMDGTIHDIDEPFASHPNCRCTPVPVVEGSAFRSTGPQEFARLSEADQRAVLGVGRFELYRNGMPLSTFVQETQSSVWGPGRQVRPLRELKLSQVQTAPWKPAQPLSRHDVLRVKEDEFRPLRYERAFVVDVDGKTIFEKGGEQYEVSFTAEETRSARGGYMTHNHPRGYDYPASDPRHAGNSFSKEDVRFARTAGLAEVRAVTPRHRYVIQPGSGGWDDLVEAGDKYDRQVRSEFMRAIQNGTLTIEQAEARHWHEVWTRAARETGAVYEQEDD